MGFAMTVAGLTQNDKKSIHTYLLILALGGNGPSQTAVAGFASYATLPPLPQQTRVNNTASAQAL